LIALNRALKENKTCSIIDIEKNAGVENTKTEGDFVRTLNEIILARKIDSTYVPYTINWNFSIDWVVEEIEGLQEVPENLKILAIENPLLDISAEVPHDLLTKYGVKAGEALLAEEKHMPLYEEIVKNYPVKYIAGGSALNVARVAAHLHPNKQTLGYIGCVGRDKEAQILRKNAEDGGVFVNLMECDVPTGACAVLIDGKERTLVTKLQAANEYKISHLQEPLGTAMLKKVEAVYSTGFFITVSPDSLRHIAKHCAEHNKPFLMNLSAPFIMQVLPFLAVLKEILPYVDILIGNDDEARALGSALGLGGDIREIGVFTAKSDKVNSHRARTVIFTQGAHPTLAFHDGQVEEFPVVPIEKGKIVDTNGAGDSFVGGFLSRFAERKLLKECMAAGSYAAFVVIQQSGCAFPDSMPRVTHEGFSFP